ncbi:MAG: porin [Polyangiaceae bacterium]
MTTHRTRIAIPLTLCFCLAASISGRAEEPTKEADTPPSAGQSEAPATATADEPAETSEPKKSAEAKPAEKTAAVATSNENDSPRAAAEAPAPTAVPTPAAKEIPAKSPRPSKSVHGNDPHAAPSSHWRSWLKWERGPLMLTPVALLTVQTFPYVGEQSYLAAGDDVESAGLRLHHARLGVDGAISKKLRYRFSADLATGNDNDTRIHAAWAAYQPIAAAGLKIGGQTLPTSRSAVIPSVYHALVDRPLAVRAMAPLKQLGLTAQGQLANHAFGYQVGIFNGLRRSGRFYEGYEHRYGALGNRFDGLAYAIRLTSEPVGRLASTVADETHGPLGLGLGGGYVLSRGGALTTHIASGDVHLQKSGFHALAEVLWSLATPDELPTIPSDEVDDTSSLGLSVEAGYSILPRRLGVALRFEFIDPNQRIEDESDNWRLQAGVSYHLIDQLLEAKLNYAHREEFLGEAQANDMVVLQLGFLLHPTSRARP